MQVESVPGSNFINGQNNLSSSGNEMFNKMNNDPLMVMRAEEQKALKRIVSNPVKMKQIQAAVSLAESSLKRKKDKKHKKEHKKEHRHLKEHKRKETRTARSRSYMSTISLQDVVRRKDIASMTIS